MKKIILLLFAVSLLFVGCRKEIIKTTEPEVPVNMENLDIAAGFNWKTTTDYMLKVTAPQSGLLRINNKEDVTFYSILLDAEQQQSLKMTIPSYLKSVYLVYNNEKIELELKEDVLTYNFNN